MRTFIKESKASISKNDLELLFNLLGDFHPKNVLEIGTWKGYSAKIWYEAFHPDKLVTIEIESKEVLDGEEIVDKQVVYLWETDSTLDATRVTVINTLGSNNIDFLFVDGNHEYEAVKKDWNLYSKHLSNKAVVVFHDITLVGEQWKGGVEVNRLWNEIKDNYNWVEIRSKDSTGMGILFL